MATPSYPGHVQNVVHSRRRQSRSVGDIPKAESPATHCALGGLWPGHTHAYPWPTPSCQRFAGTPAIANAPHPQSIPGADTASCASARPRGPTWAKNTPAWQLAIFPNAPQYCRATPAVHPLLGKVAAVQHPHRLRMLQPRTQMQPADDRVGSPRGFGKKTLQHRGDQQVFRLRRSREPAGLAGIAHRPATACDRKPAHSSRENPGRPRNSVQSCRVHRPTSPPVASRLAVPTTVVVILAGCLIRRGGHRTD